jgi:exodeoxyribonuclease VII small subunit
MVRSPKKAGIEARLRALEDIVQKIEDGTLPLEESLVLFEEGIRLSRELQATLQAASLKVSRLLDGEGTQEGPLKEMAGSPPENPGEVS